MNSTAEVTASQPAPPRIFKFPNPGECPIGEPPASSLCANDAPNHDPPVFPTHLLPTPLQGITSETARLFQLPDELPGALALGAASAALGQGIVLQNPPFETTGNLYVLVCAASGTGKSNAFRIVMEPLYTAEGQKIRDFNEKRRPELETEKIILEAQLAAEKKAVAKPHGKLSANDEDSARNRLRELKAKYEEIEGLLQPPRLIVEDTTAQKMAVVMQQSGETVALLSPEAGDVISNILGRWNSTERTDEALLLKAFSCDPFTQDRIGRPSVAMVKPCATVVLVVTPDTLDDLFSVERMKSGGLLPRFLVLPSIARPERSNGQRIPDDKIINAWRDCINTLLNAHRWRSGPSAEILLTSGAATVFEEYRNSDFVDRFDELEDVASFAARYAEQAMRIAVVLHAAGYGADAGSRPLTEETARAGVEFARFFAARQLTFMSRSRTKKRSEAARALYELVLRGPMTLRDLQRRHGHDPRRVKALAGEFPNLLLVETVKPDGAGRPSEILRTAAKT
jgi:hypothetical protein